MGEESSTAGLLPGYFTAAKEADSAILFCTSHPEYLEEERASQAETWVALDLTPGFPLLKFPVEIGGFLP